MRTIRDNKGFTLIEMIVVLVIIGIITGVSVSVTSAVNATNVSKGLPAIQTALEYCRNKTMSSAASDVYVKVEADGSYYYASIYEDSTLDRSDKVFSSKYDFQMKIDDLLVEGITAFEFRFNKSDGSLHSIKVTTTSGVESLSLSPDVDIRLYVAKHEDEALVIAPLSGRTVKQ